MQVLVPLGFPAIRYWRALGANINGSAHISSQAFVDEKYAMFLTVREGAVIAMGARFLLHDSSFCNVLGLPVRVGHTVVEEDAYIGANATILPGVVIGEGAIVAAGAVVAKDVAAGTVVAGVPAKVQGTVQDLAGRFTRAGGRRNGRYFWETYIRQSEKVEFSGGELQQMHAQFLADASGRAQSAESGAARNG
jgi:carbonic anhydrase/acetyltransferase-like protein (isoleucine patch superfamily)